MWKNLVPSRPGAKAALGKLRRAGDDAQRRRAWSESIPLYREYLALRSDDVAIWVQLGHALKEQGDLLDAENAYRQALKVAPHDDDSRVHLVALLRRVGKDAEADAFEPSPSDAPAEMPATTPMARSDKSEPSSRKAKPPAPVTNRGRGDAARDLKDWVSAAAFYADHLAENPSDVAIWVQLGHSLKEQSLLEDAIYAYSMAKKLDEHNLDMAEHLSAVLIRLGRSPDARPLWAALFEKDGSSLRAR